MNLLKKLITEQISVHKRTNVVRVDQFSVLLQGKVTAYLIGTLTSREVVKELLEIAKAMQEANEAGTELGLSVEKLAFYDALMKPRAIKDFYENQQLVELTTTLTEALRSKKQWIGEKKKVPGQICVP